MSFCGQRAVKKRVSGVASYLLLGFLLVVFLFADSRPAFALPTPSIKVNALPAFARKYGMPCSSCHEAWPKLSPFGQAFKDNGYQMGNDRDAPIFQQPAYWPVTFRMTTFWHRESQNRTQVDDPANPPLGQMEGKITTNGFDWSGLDFHTAGTLAKNYSFYVLPSSDNTASFHFEAVWARVDNILGSSWLNIKLGKFELDNLLSEKRILTLTNVAGVYANYHFQPLVSPGNPGTPGVVAESLYTVGIGDNQVGLEWMGHSKDDRTRVSASVLSSKDGQPGPVTGRGYNGYFAASRAFQLGSLGLQRVGAFAYIGQAPTFFQFTQAGVGVGGTGIGNKGYYRDGLIGMWYFNKLDVTTMFFHGWDSAFLGSNTAANAAGGLAASGARAPTWNGGLFETHYNLNPQLILINRYELIRMSRQVFASNPANFGNEDVLTVGWRYYPFISSRAGFAFHNEYAILRQRGASPVNGLDLTTSSLLVGFDFAF
jgi:hypothetical protein